MLPSLAREVNPKEETLKMAADLAHVSEIVSSMIRCHTATIARRTAHELRWYQDEERTVWMISGVLELMEADLERDCREMLDTVHCHAFELGGDVTARTRRDEATARLRQVYIRTREEYALLYDREVALAAGFARKTPRLPQRLFHQAWLTRALNWTAGQGLQGPSHEVIIGERKPPAPSTMSGGAR